LQAGQLVAPGSDALVDVDVLVPITGVAVRCYTLAAPGKDSVPPVFRPLARADPVRGWLVGVTDGTAWGWWGPVLEGVAEHVRLLYEHARPKSPTTPAGWGRRLRQGTRHAHTGLLGIAVGTFELACWDLAGQRSHAPVWALWSSSSAPAVVSSYATCFGVAVDDRVAERVAREIAQVWPVQKWALPEGHRSLDELERVANAAGGDDRLAVDFRGQWAPDAIVELVRHLPVRLAWVEEPYAPCDLHRAVPGEFGVPHAAGEHCYGPFEAAVLARAGVSIWQPDAVFCGGYADLCLLLRAAVAAGARAAPHGGGFLPAVHAAAAGEPVWLVEYHILLEPRRQAHFREEAHPGFSMGSVRVPVPTAPGWGGGLRPEVLGDVR
jgi:L-alanine-DL-glutamate epimerase-like enolase superfamily enzyme